MDKGYAHPLYSLDLAPHAALPEDEPRYAILLPEGRLVVRAELRRRAQSHGVLAVDRLVGTALAYQRLAPQGFARFGLGPHWAESLRHWRAQMLEEDEVQAALAVERAQALAVQREVQGRARAALGRLALSARLAGLAERPVPARAPESAAALSEAIDAALARCGAAVPASLLARCGFAAEDRAALQALGEELPRRQAARVTLEARCRAQADGLLVIKAALLGDAARLCQAAPQVLGPERCETLRVAPLLRGRELRGA